MASAPAQQYNTCYICLEQAGTNGMGPLYYNSCRCRGGLCLHKDCLGRYLALHASQHIDSRELYLYKDTSHTAACSICKQQYQFQMAIRPMTLKEMFLPNYSAWLLRARSPEALIWLFLILIGPILVGLQFSVYRDTWIKLGVPGWFMLYYTSANACLTALQLHRHAAYMSAEWKRHFPILSDQLALATLMVTQLIMECAFDSTAFIHNVTMPEHFRLVLRVAMSILFLVVFWLVREIPFLIRQYVFEQQRKTANIDITVQLVPVA